MRQRRRQTNMAKKNDDSSDSDVERVLDGIESAKKWYDENKDLIERFTGGGNGVDLTDTGPMTEAEVHDDRVIVVADVPGVRPTDMRVKFYENAIQCTIDGESFKATVPSDVDEDSLSADMKNGVLRVEMERENAAQDEAVSSNISHTDDTIPNPEGDGIGERDEGDPVDELADLVDDDNAQDDNESAEEGGED
jgi:HSP20 family molecular chaperone IbpA